MGQEQLHSATGAWETHRRVRVAAETDPREKLPQGLKPALILLTLRHD
jgi:hypothetical protein